MSSAVGSTRHERRRGKGHRRHLGRGSLASGGLHVDHAHPQRYLRCDLPVGNQTDADRIGPRGHAQTGLDVKANILSYKMEMHGSDTSRLGFREIELTLDDLIAR